jgi:phosphonate transport system substrate-binding protein
MKYVLPLAALAVLLTSDVIHAQNAASPISADKRGDSNNECSHRGDLDSLYCDENRDLVAEPPKDAAKWRDPSTIVFAYTPIEDPAVYQNVFKHFTEYFAACTSKKVVYFNVQNNAAQIEAMRAGRLHVSGLSSGQTGFAVNLAGAVPFAIKGSERGPRSYQQVVIVKRDSPFQKLSDLKGKKVAHVSPSSNSGHLAPLVLFPKEGITPGKDYNIVFSGKHDQSLAGVLKGDYDAAPITSDLIERWVLRGNMKADDVRVIYRSQNFPTTSFAHAHDLNPALATKIKQCFFDYRFPPEMKKEFLGEDRFVPVDYKRDWDIVREITKASGASYTRNQFDRENKPAP